MFDVFTVLAKSSLVDLLLSAILLLFWLRARRHPWLLLGSIAYLSISTATIIIALEPILPEIVRYMVTNTLLVFGFLLLWQVLRVFNGQRVKGWIVAVATIAWPTFWLVPGFDDDRMIRIVLFSLPMTVALALAAREAWHGCAERLPSRNWLAMLLGAQSILFGIRIPLGPFAPFPLGILPPNDLVVAGFFGLMIVLSVGQTVLIISMTLEREELRQRKLASTDALTGLLNRHGLETVFENDRLPKGTALVMFDLDEFKNVNDTYGHAAGDAVLIGFARICRQQMRQIDYAVRLGGEEIAVVLSRVDRAKAVAVAERIRMCQESCVVDVDGASLKCTVSGGVFFSEMDSPVHVRDALAAADRALYRAKSTGRNRICEELASASGAHVHAGDDRALRTQAAPV